MRTEVAGSAATALGTAVDGALKRIAVTATTDGRPDACPRCAGRGWVVAEDGGNGAARRCDCRLQDRNVRLLAQSGIPDRYRHCRLDNFEIGKGPDSKALKEALRRAESFVSGIWDSELNRPRHDGLLMIGIPGSGKTHLATAVLAESILRYGLRGLFVDFTDLIFRIQSTFDPSSEESAHRVLDPVRRAELLVIDELGAQKPTDFVMNTLYLIINGRYTERLPTIFTTNFRLEASSQQPSNTSAALVSDSKASSDLGKGPTPPANPLMEDAKRSELLATRISVQLVSRLYEMAPRPVIFPERDYRRVLAGGRKPATDR